jgi:hypothetical protein
MLLGTATPTVARHQIHFARVNQLHYKSAPVAHAKMKGIMHGVTHSQQPHKPVV